MSKIIRLGGNFIIWAMLGILTVTIIPREVWHQHDHIDHSHNGKLQEVSGSDECLICDFQLLPYTADLSAFDEPDKPAYCALTEFRFLFSQKNLPATNPGRAPPLI